MHTLTGNDAATLILSVLQQQGWITERIHDSGTFCRMVIRSADSGVLIDLAVNAPPDLPASATPAGPTLAPEELAGNKLLALFDRAAARDFADVYMLARRFGKEVLLARAALLLPKTSSMLVGAVVRVGPVLWCAVG